MTKHLRDVHPEQYTKYLSDKAAAKKEKANKIKENKELEEEVEKRQDQIDELQGTSSQVRRRLITKPIAQYFAKYDKKLKYEKNSDLQRRAEMDIAIYIVTGNLSFNHVESKAFRRFMAAREPKLTVKSRSSLVKTTLPLLERNLNEAKDKLLAKHLPKVPGAAFTTDIWSSKGQHSYLALTMHFIDDDWKLHNLVMAVSHLEEPNHTGELICSKTEAMLEDIPLPSSATITFTTDGASSMVKAMRESPLIHDHIICFCHIISNCLQDAFSHSMIEPAVNKLKELAGATHKSIKRITAIRRVCNELESK